MSNLSDLILSDLMNKHSAREISRKYGVSTSYVYYVKKENEKKEIFKEKYRQLTPYLSVRTINALMRNTDDAIRTKNQLYDLLSTDGIEGTNLGAKSIEEIENFLNIKICVKHEMRKDRKFGFIRNVKDIFIKKC